MERDIALALNHVLQRFKGMQFDNQTLGYLEMEINDMLYRIYPDFNAEFYVSPKFIQERSTIQFISTRKH